MWLHRLRAKVAVHRTRVAANYVTPRPEPEQDATLTEYAASMHLDSAGPSSARTDGRFDGVFEKDKAFAEDAGILGPSPFLINGYFLSAAQPLKAFECLARYGLGHPAPAAKPGSAAASTGTPAGPASR